MMAEWLKCDQCVAQAMWQVKKEEMNLYFCGHHKNEQGNKLIDWSNEMIELLNYEQELTSTE